MLPKWKTRKSKTRMRRSHHALNITNIQTCPECGNVIQPHCVCSDCGYYKGKQIVNVFQKLSKKDEKRKRKEQEQRRREEEARQEEEQSAKSLDASQLSQKS